MDCTYKGVGGWEGGEVGGGGGWEAEGGLYTFQLDYLE